MQKNEDTLKSGKANSIYHCGIENKELTDYGQLLIFLFIGERLIMCS